MFRKFVLIMLGMIQGLNEQVREAKATLQRAAQLARNYAAQYIERQDSPLSVKDRRYR